MKIAQNMQTIKKNSTDTMQKAPDFTTVSYIFLIFSCVSGSRSTSDIWFTPFEVFHHGAACACPVNLNNYACVDVGCAEIRAMWLVGFPACGFVWKIAPAFV